MHSPLLVVTMALTAWCVVAVAQPGSTTIHVTDPAAVGALRNLNSRINALSKLASECAQKNIAQPELCFCKYPAELDALRKEYQAVIRAYPAWSSRTVAWNESSGGTAVGYTIAIGHLGPQLNKCSNR